MPFKIRRVQGEVLHPQLLGVFIVLTVAPFLFSEPRSYAIGVVSNIYETVIYVVAPSAERAFSYGVRHLDSLDGASYDVVRAQYFFEKAAQQDPDFPYVYHELARTYFLQGDLDTALGFIEAHISKFGTTTPNSYYVRGLILGYMGRYQNAARDYERYLAFDTTNWAAANDYAWVLLKAGRSREALAVVEPRLTYWPENPWLLNSAAIAAYEVGEIDNARAYIGRAFATLQGLTKEEWLVAYPGNDPRIADVGIAALRKSVADNMHTIESGTPHRGVQ